MFRATLFELLQHWMSGLTPTPGHMILICNGIPQNGRDRSPQMQPSPTFQQRYANRLFQIAVLVLIAFGLLLRASKYLPGYSMRGDELAVTQNLIDRSALDLMTKPLDYEQAAPFGFVLLVKALITALGPSEYVLRLVAFVAGCASLILMQDLLGKTVAIYGNLFALAAFAFSNYLIYYAAELKQYSSDVLLALALLLVFHQHLIKETTARDFVILAVLGTVSLCFSYPAVFVLAALGVTLLLHYWRDRQRLLWITLTGVLWAGTFLFLYFALLRGQTEDPYLITFWDNLLSFMPMPPWQEPSWFPKALSGLFFVVAGLSSSLLLVIPLYLLGLWGFWSERRWQWAVVLALPIGLNILVSGFEKYPFHGRLILYLVPLVFLVLGKGIDVLVRLAHNRLLANAAFAVLLILLLRPVITTTNSYLVLRDYLQDDLKPVLAFMEVNKQDGDLVYVYHYIEQPYAYYAPQYDLEALPVVVGQNNSAEARKYQEELSSLPREQRIWFLFSFVHETRIRKGVKRDERVYILNYLRDNGTLLDEFYARNNASSVHLFVLK